ncbi:tetratricopeptide repeat protein [Gallaecimonas kandeliae]|uniref:tetratricopeptide repeat protein n=1 Tax=Gallaecimonas kandeliae TaxID=3029055 RepID=UPI0026470DA3|nr:tetratricopeptide repeat protein [Gallaecimonas kandeliae]WKE64447.1 tetratricopeptide repeat protein [Gallaecimonas kandeliae]
MKKLASSLLAVLALAGAVTLPQSALADDNVVQVKEVPKRKTQALSESAGRPVTKAYDLFSKEDYAGALKILQDMSPHDGYDKAYVDRFIGTIYYYQEKWDQSLQYLKRAADSGALNQTEQEGVLRQVGQMLQQREKWRESLTYLQKWMDFSGKESADVFTMMAQAYYQMKELDKVVPFADKAIKLYKKPNKNPYVLKLAAFFDRKMYKQMVPVLEELVKLDPKEKQWWLQLGQTYMLVNDSDKALATYALAYKQGFLTKENEGKVLAQLYASQDIPYKSAIIQEKFMKAGLIPEDESSLAILANTWHNAKELDKAIEYYGRAGEAGKDGKHFLKQGNLLLEQEKYEKAIVALNKAIDAGNLSQPGRAYLALAQAYFFKHDYKGAIKQLRLAKGFDDTKKTATSWESYVKDEATRKGVQF